VVYDVGNAMSFNDIVDELIRYILERHDV